MACKKLTFQIDGDPIPMRNQIPNDVTFWTESKQERLRYKLTILNQYEKQVKKRSKKPPYEPKPLNGLVQLTLHFFLAPKPMMNLPKVNHKPHCESPRLTDLERFVENILTQLVFTKACKITNIYADKIYDENPRTIIEIKVS